MIVDTGMSTVRVIPSLDEFENSHPSLGLSAETAVVDEFAFERGEEALTLGIVEAVSNRAHGGPNAAGLGAP
jgi:hypothetical protein